MIELEKKVLQPLLRSNSWYTALAGVLSLMLVVMLVALYHQGTEGGGATGGESDGHWGAFNTGLVFFLGLSMAGILISSIVRIAERGASPAISRPAEVMAVAAAIMALLSAIMAIGDLGLLVDSILYGDISSPIVWEGILVALYLIAAFGVLYFAMVPDLDRFALKVPRWRYLYRILSFGYSGTDRQKADVRRVVLWVTLISTVTILAVHLGLAFAVDSVADQPSWNEALAGPAFITEGLMMGFAILVGVLVLFHHGLGLAGVVRPKVLERVGFVLMLVIALNLIVLAATTLSHEDAAEIWAGDYAPITVAILVAGFVAPACILALTGPGNPKGLLPASMLAGTTMWVKGYLVVVPGLTAHDVVHAGGLYAPTLAEWALMLGSFAFFGITMMVMFRIIPVLSLWEVEEDRFIGSEEEEVSPA